MPEILIVDYDPTWPEQFEMLKAQLLDTLGDSCACIDHIGSTSVPGLAAKDIIDVQVTVLDLDAVEFRDRLGKAGYRFNDQITHDLLTGYPEDSIELKKQFFAELPGERRANIHIRQQGRINQKYPLLFRDFLSADDLARAAYEQVKRALAHHFPDDVDAYYSVKDPYMDTIYRAATYWAKQTGCPSASG